MYLLFELLLFFCFVKELLDELCLNECIDVKAITTCECLIGHELADRQFLATVKILQELFGLLGLNDFIDVNALAAGELLKRKKAGRR